MFLRKVGNSLFIDAALYARKTDSWISIHIYILILCFASKRAMTSSFLRFLHHTQRRTTFDTTPLYERSARRRALYRTTHNTHKRQVSTPPAGFEPTIPASEGTQTYALDRAATETCWYKIPRCFENIKIFRPVLIAINQLSSKSIQLEVFVF